MKNTLLLFASILFFCISHAQPGSNDPTFNPMDSVFGKGYSFNAHVNSVSIQIDDKIIVGGRFSTFNEVERQYLARLNADGSLDDSFNIGIGFDNDVLSTAIQSDGKIVVGGWFTSFNRKGRNYLARLNPDGSLDGTFNSGIGFNNIIFTISIQTDGKIIVGGRFTSFNGVNVNSIVRLNEDGSLDESFNLGKGFNNYVFSTTIQTDGKIIVGGIYTSYNGADINSIARLNTDGTLDTSFDPGNGVDSHVLTTALQADGKIILGGRINSFNGTECNHIVRLNSDGSFDTSFNCGNGFNEVVHSIILQDDGKIFVGGRYTRFDGSVNNRIICLNSDGSKNESFNSGNGFSQQVLILAFQSNNRIVVGGEFYTYDGHKRNFITRLLIDGSLDETFNPSTGFNDIVHCIAVQDDNKIIVGGVFTSYNGKIINRIARLTADGLLDNTFNSGIGFNDIVQCISMQKDGKILAGGIFTSFDGTERNFIARLNTDGSLDSTFNPETGFDWHVNSISIQSDEKIIVGGRFTSFTGIDRKFIARLNSDGSLDTTFSPGTGFDWHVHSITILANDKILAVGWFSTFNGTERNCIALLNTDGSLDTFFNPGNGFNPFMKCIAIQADGKLIVGGYSTSYDGAVINQIVRLNGDGSLDNSFNAETGYNEGIYSITIQNDQKIISTSYLRLARLNSDGTLDTSFDPGTGFNGSLRASAIQSDGKIIIGGGFTSYNGITRHRIARLFSECQASYATDLHTVCDSLTWIDGNTYTENNNSASHILQTSSGCDSIVTLDLTINSISDTDIDIIDGAITANNSSATYIWLDCDNNFEPISGETGQIYLPETDGNYAVELRENGCVDTSACVQFTMVSLFENDLSSKLLLYPNPTSGIFTIDLGESLPEFKVSIYDSFGKRIQSSTFTNSQFLTINLIEKTGVYMIHVETDSKKATLRLVRE